jgi:hypothetical protein
MKHRVKFEVYIDLSLSDFGLPANYLPTIHETGLVIELDLDDIDIDDTVLAQIIHEHVEKYMTMNITPMSIEPAKVPA